MADEAPRPLQARIAPEWLSIVDNWRHQQPDIPARAEAIRRLIDEGIRTG